MNPYVEMFPSGKQIFPVIHLLNHDQALENTKIAFNEGADGVFLIDHHHKTPKLLKECFATVRDAYPDFKIGLNFLTLSSDQAFSFCPDGVFAIWSDSARNSLSQDGMMKLKRGWRIHHSDDSQIPIYFGGVAFKYQGDVESDPKEAAEIARIYVDVITTSGPRTGTPPSTKKLRLMHEGAQGHPIALASGATPQNIEQFLPYVNCILVATGVSVSETQLDPTKVSEIVKKVKAAS